MAGARTSLLVVLAPFSTAQDGARTTEQPEPPAEVEAAPSAEDFEAGFESASRLMALRNWKSAQSAWLDLLRRHAGLEHVRPKLELIRLALQKCAFWLVTREPPVKDLVQAEMRGYSPSSGQVELRYRSDTLGDFEVTEGRYWHPLTFRGPYSIQIEGDASRIDDVTLYVGWERGGGYVLDIGGSGSSDHVLQLFEGARIDVVAISDRSDERGSKPPAQRKEQRAKDKKEPKPRGPTRVVLKLDSKSISFTYDGERVLEAENRRGKVGRFGFEYGGYRERIRPPADLGELVIKGTIEPSWIDGLLDAFLQKERTYFDRSYVEPAELAAWDVARSEVSAEVRFGRWLASLPIPGTLPPAGIALVRRVRARSGVDEARALDEELRELSPGTLSADTLALLRALCAFHGRWPDRALAHLDEHERLAGTSPPLDYLRALLLLEVESASDAIAILERLAAADAAEPLVHLHLSAALVEAGRYEEARVAIERALATKDPPAEHEEWRAYLAKARFGPEWQRTYVHATARFVVSSDLDQESCRSASRELDETWARCEEWFGKLPDSGAPTRVYLFSGEAGYRSYVGRAGAEDTIGVYKPVLQQILAWNTSDRERLLRTLRHECVHLYLHRSLGELPTWLDEGVAEYVAASKLPDRRWKRGAVDEPGLAQLAARRLTPLARFLRLDQPAFLRGDAHYPQAWLFVHFLRDGDDPGATDLFQRVWGSLAGRSSPEEAVESALEGLDIPALEAAFVAHANRLLVEQRAR